MELLAWKLRIAALWIFLGVGMLAMTFAVIMPAAVLAEYVATGKFEGETIDATMLATMVALFCLLPLAMAFLTLALPDSISRYANAILGVVAVAMWVWDLAEHSTKGLEVGALLTITLIIAALLIVWHAWRWPKPAEQDLPERQSASSSKQRATGTV